jgi:transcription elongation factor GreA
MCSSRIPAPVRLPLPSGAVNEDVKNAISPEGQAEAEAELKELTEVRRPAIVAAIKAAREEGDLSENAEYHAAREEQGMNEARIRVLEELLASATIVEASSGGIVGPGSQVSFRDSSTDDVTDVTLVHRLEADLTEGKLSVESPIAKALLGTTKGDQVSVATPSGSKTLEILAVG